MEITFKLATEKDGPEILKMMEQFNSIDNYPFQYEQTEKNLLLFLGDPNLGRAWMIEENNSIIGYIILAFGFSFEYGGRDAFIDELFLKTAFRQKGIGKLAMDFIQEQAQIHGVKVVHLEVEQHNEVAENLYKRNGYKHNGRLLLSRRITDSKKI